MTFVVNSQRPNLSYTCVVPESTGLSRNSKDKMVFAELEVRVAGALAFWLVTQITVI